MHPVLYVPPRLPLEPFARCVVIAADQYGRA